MEEGIPRCLWAAPVLSLAVYLLCPGNSPLLASTIPFLIEHVRRSFLFGVTKRHCSFQFGVAQSPSPQTHLCCARLRSNLRVAHSAHG